MSNPHRVKFAVSCTSDDDHTPPPCTPLMHRLDATRPSPLVGHKLAYSGRMAHLAALVAPAVAVHWDDSGGCGEDKAMLGSAMPYSCIPRLARRLPLEPTTSTSSGREHVVGELARRHPVDTALMAPVVVAWAGEQWISTSEFVVAAGIAATKVCGRPAMARHKAVVAKYPLADDGAYVYVLRLVEFTHGEQRGRFFVH